MQTLTFRIWISNEGLLHGTGNHIQAPEIKHDGIDTLGGKETLEGKETLGGKEILEKIKAACKARLSKYEQPRVFIALDRLPMTETGKPARAEAMKIAAAYKENQ